MTTTRDFDRHLKHASEVVATWPVWKQTLLGGEATTMSMYLPDAWKVEITGDRVMIFYNGKLCVSATPARLAAFYCWLSEERNALRKQVDEQQPKDKP